MYRSRNSARCYIVRHMCLHLVVMDRVDQPMSVALGCCTTINWLAATIPACVAYVVGFSMSWRYSVQPFGTNVFEGNRKVDVCSHIVYPRRK